MRFLAAHYRREDSALSLILQQVTRRKGEIPILFAGILEQREAGLAERKERDARQTGIWLAEYLTEWFYEQALPECTKRGEASCVDSVQGLFAERVGRYERKNGADAAGAMAVLFAMGQECFYAWRGEAQIRLVNRSFDRRHVRKLTDLAEEIRYERAFWEPETGLVLGAADFFDCLPPDALKACLGVQELEQAEQAKRHLAEAAGEAERRGARETAAVFVAARE